MKKRIWELDALRGIAVIGFIWVHINYDLIYLFRIWQPKDYFWIDMGFDWGGVAFVLISGICVTLGSQCIKRGLQVLACGAVITAVTVGMYFLNFVDKSIIIYFGVLQCLGVCMLLWPLFRKLPWWALLALGAAMVAVGLQLKFGNVRCGHHWLTVLGVPAYSFASSDYFPLLPNLGYFLLGAFLGKTAYRRKESLLPMVNENFFLLRFFRFLGRHSLVIYLVHQPVIAAVIYLYTLL